MDRAQKDKAIKGQGTKGKLAEEQPLEPQAFQDLIPDNFCFGCGPTNPNGLRIKSFWHDDGESICHYQPEPHHTAGPTQILNGGIIATLIDCHCICTAIADSYRREGREIGSTPTIWYATASLNVSYLKPAPIKPPVRLLAHVIEATGKKTSLTCEVLSGNTKCAAGEVVAVRVPAAWRR